MDIGKIVKEEERALPGIPQFPREQPAPRPQQQPKPEPVKQPEREKEHA